ncbi:MAG: DUF1638 domain-containing protein [Anaerolineae bacterium]
MHLRLIACEVLAREVYFCAARSKNVINIELVEKGLHEKPETLRARLQQHIDETCDGPYQAILLGYGLCSNSVAGLLARKAPLVIPRAHDCITLYLGSMERYNSEFSSHPGTFYYTADYIERPSTTGEWAALGSSLTADLEATYNEYVEKYGKDNADYLMEVMGAWREHYTRSAFIDMGIIPPGDYESQAREEAKRRGWLFERLKGDMALLCQMLEGDWPEEKFLIVQPGQKVVATYDERIIGCSGCSEGGD